MKRKKENTRTPRGPSHEPRYPRRRFFSITSPGESSGGTSRKSLSSRRTPNSSPRASRARCVPILLQENPQTFSEKNTKSASQPVRTRIAPHAGRQHVQQRPPRPQKRQQDRPLRAHLPGPPQDPRAVGLTGERTRFADVAHERRPPAAPRGVARRRRARTSRIQVGAARHRPHRVRLTPATTKGVHTGVDAR